MKKKIIRGLVMRPTEENFGVPLAFISDGKVVEILSNDKNLEKMLTSVFKNSQVAKSLREELGEDFDPCAYLAQTAGQQFIYDDIPFTVAEAKKIRSFFEGAKNDK